MPNTSVNPNPDHELEDCVSRSPKTPTKLNGAIHVHSSIMKMVLASASEAVVGAFFPTRKTLAIFGKPYQHSAILSPLPPFKPTMHVPMAS
jgi:hypothetical protein